MKISYIFQFIVIPMIICLIPAAALCEDTNIIFKHDQTGVADEVNQMKNFDFELQQRERDRMKQWNIEDSGDALKVGDVYYEKGEIEDAIAFYQIAIKIDPANTQAHAKYIDARNIEKEQTPSHYHRAMEYYRQGMKDKAVDELIAEIKENPDNEEARIQLNVIESQ
jgi:tetratricopeptide (TPR) repeat protein